MALQRGADMFGPDLEGGPMFDQVMIGIDEHQGGRDAIALARWLVSPQGKLTIAYVHSGYPVRSRGGVTPEFAGSERERALELLTRARAESGVDAELRCIGSSSVGRGLHELAEVEGADLLVVGSTRRGLVGRVMVGDDTSRALNGAPCAVAIAPAGYARESAHLPEIGVGYDESAESRHALEVARAFAAERNATLSAFQAITLPSYLFLGGSAPIDGTLEEYVEDARARMREFHDVESHATYGDPVEELTLYSASIDLLVVGSRGFGPVGRLVHGSTSQRLARTARCPLLVLTRAARESSLNSGADTGARAAVA
jgi:nucleotide-binding universal stress UspA family protein